MSALAELEVALWQDRAYARLADTHLHRAVREDSLGVLKSRDALTAAWVVEEKRAVTIAHDFDDMIVADVDGLGRLHRWIDREDARIVRETLVENFARPKSAPPAHPPLGELRSGQGQYAAGDRAILAAGFPATARELADRLHRAWNGRAFDLHGAAWLIRLCAMFPDATFHFERALVSGATTALLWRVHGHHASGRRIRLIGSSVFTPGEEDTLLDRAALTAQSQAAHIEY